MNVELPHVNNARANIIPYGNCVDDDAVLFERLDQGRATQADIKMGKLACTTVCPQFSVCEANIDTVATALYKYTGETSPVVAGEVASVPTADTCRSVTLPAVGFDVSRLPQQPELALKFLRQAVRAEKLITGPRMPAIVPVIAKQFIALTAQRDPELHEWLIHPNLLGKEKMFKGLCDITTLLFQQADYPRVAKGIKYEKRYTPDRIDMDQHYGITYTYAQDMRTLAQAGFKLPARQALAFSPEEYQELVDHYSVEINPTDLHYILSHNVLDPEKALRERLARLRILREEYHGTKVPDSVLRERARWRINKHSTAEVERKQPPPRIKPDAVRAIYAEAAANDHTAQSQGSGTVKETVIGLQRAFGDSPYFPSPVAVGLLAYLPFDDAMAKCKKIMGRIEEATEAAKAQDIPEFYARQFAERSHAPTSELAALYADHQAVSRLLARARWRTPHTRPPVWSLRKVIELYVSREEIDDAANNMFELMNYNMLDTGLAELKILQGLNHRAQLSDICTAKTGRYITFGPALRSLKPEDRLALASYYGLGRLFYGQNIEPEAVAPLYGLREIDSYVETKLLPQCKALCDDPSKNDGMPTSLMRLNADLDILEWNAPKTTERTAPVNGDITTVIGGSAVQLGESGVSLNSNHDVSHWLKGVIFHRCKPHHNEMAADIENAVLQGVLVITGDSPDTYKIAFDDYLVETCDEQELAALSHAIGVDTFVYGTNIKEILEARTGMDIGQVAQATEQHIRHLRDGKEPSGATARQIAQERQKTIHQLDMAIPVISRSMFPRTTPQQIQKLQQMLAFHFGRMREQPAAVTPQDKKLFDKGMRTLLAYYAPYDESRSSSPTQPKGPATDIVRALLGEPKASPDGKPIPLLPLLQATHKTLGDKSTRELHHQVYRQLIDLGRYIAARQAGN